MALCRRMLARSFALFKHPFELVYAKLFTRVQTHTPREHTPRISRAHTHTPRARTHSKHIALTHTHSAREHTHRARTHTPRIFCGAGAEATDARRNETCLRPISGRENGLRPDPGIHEKGHVRRPTKCRVGLFSLYSRSILLLL